MSDLSSIERIKLEKLFTMDGGYVLDFSNRTFENFICENTGINIYDKKYDYESGSKANRLRAFWIQESNYIVGKLILDLLQYWKTQKITNDTEVSQAEQFLFDECSTIAERLMQNHLVEHIDAIQPYSDDKNFSLLAKSIRDSITKNEPEVALDRLHTFVIKYIRELCDRHGMSYDKSKPLHSLFGEYVKYLKQNNIIESTMTERILKSSISILESFNDVRNQQSLAHDNPILNYDETVLIFNNISSIIKFIEAIEEKFLKDNEKDKVEVEWEDFPF